jgi:peptidyl-dipeptidase Dcp
MNKVSIFCAALSVLAATSAISKPATSAMWTNPFAQPSTLPLQAPDFSKIKDTDYTPAFEDAMRVHLAEIEKIANNKAAPTFDNTIVAMEKAGRMLDRVGLAFSAVVGANTNDTLDKTQTDTAPELAAHQDAIYLNAKLFARVKAIYDARAS